MNDFQYQQEQRELPQTALILVGKNGDYPTLQEAVDAVPEENTTPVVIRLLPGIYREKVRIPGTKPYITLEGEDAELVYDDYAGKKMPNGDMMGTFRSATLSVYAHDFTMRKLTLRNVFDGIHHDGNRQALALYASGERIRVEDCHLISKQDTLYTRDGSQFYLRCTIEGDVDFIFGGARTVFSECTIVSLLRSPGEPIQGFVAAPSTYLAQRWGYFFDRCTLIGPDCPEGSVYLGRPWHAGSDPFAVGACIYRNCEFGKHIHPDGWTDMGGFLGKNARFGEWKNHSEGKVNAETRPLLENAEAITYSMILGF